MQFEDPTLKPFKMSDRGYKLKLPCGEVLPDVLILPNFLQSFAPVGLDDPAVIWKSIMGGVPTQDSTKPIVLDPTGQTPLLVKGDHPSLHYRGGALKRNKMWLQGGDFQDGLVRYYYTGFQNGISLASRDVKAVPVVDKIMTWLNKTLSRQLAEYNMPGDHKSSKPFNHAIVTSYASGDDYIGQHSDKVRSFEDDSYFLVIKFGADRLFEFCKPKEAKPFFSRVLPAGSAVLIRAKATDGTIAGNQRVTHGVPIMKGEPVGPSGSIVFRAIKEVMPWSEVHKKIATSCNQKIKREAIKARRFRSRESKLVHNSAECPVFVATGVSREECVPVMSAKGMRLCSTCFSTKPKKRKHADVGVVEDIRPSKRIVVV